jgi:hypothetical protein
VAEVASDDLCVGAVPGERQREVAAARGEVEDSPWIPLADNSGCAPPPENVDAAAEHVVREVVARGDGREEASDRIGILWFVRVDEVKIEKAIRFSNVFCGSFRAIVH